MAKQPHGIYCEHQHINPSTQGLLNDSSWHDSGAVFKGNLNVANCLQFDLK